MKENGQTSRSVLLFSLVAMILPLLAFPSQFGTELARSALVNVLFELAYYSFIVFLFHRRTSLIRMLEGAGLCLVYRLGIGAVFGLFISAMYGMDIGVSLSLGMSGYIPALLFHIGLAPFVLKPIIGNFMESETENRRSVSEAHPSQPVETGRTSIAASKKRGAVTESSFRPAEPAPVNTEPVSPPSIPGPAPMLPPTNLDSNGFDRAVAYIGEHKSVSVAAIVDVEGLLMATFDRGTADAERIAPIALAYVQNSQEVVRSCQLEGLNKLDLVLDTERLMITRCEEYCLVVLAKRQDDDLLSIRVNQGADMVNRYVEERFGEKANSNVENIYVSGTQ